ncbi:MAG: hypothetical protein ACPL7K_02570, partial [Armatimonadota bacterium]
MLVVLLIVALASAVTADGRLFEIVSQEELSTEGYAEEPSLAADGRGRVWASWLTRDKGGVEHVWVSVNDGRWSTPIRVTPDDAAREWPRIACGPTGGPMVVWVRICGGR